MVLPKDRPIATTAGRSRRDRAVRYVLLASALIFGYLTVVSTVVYAIGLPFILVTLLICLMLVDILAMKSQKEAGGASRSQEDTQELIFATPVERC